MLEVWPLGGLFLGARFKCKGRPIDAITQARGGGAVRKHVTYMSTTGAKMHFGPNHEERAIGRGADSFGKGREEGRPARPTFKLARRIEKPLLAARA